MNIYELQHRFNLEVSKFGRPPLQSTLIEDWINFAYQSYITKTYDSLINPAEKFEITERITSILEPLIKDVRIAGATFAPNTINSQYGIDVSKPLDLQYIIKDTAILNYTDCNGVATTGSARILPIKHSMVEVNKNNPFYKPENLEIWRLRRANKIELILYPDVTLSEYILRYLKKQTAVAFNPAIGLTGEMEIDSSVHEEIVVMAAYMYLGNLNQNKPENEKTQG